MYQNPNFIERVVGIIKLMILTSIAALPLMMTLFAIVYQEETPYPLRFIIFFWVISMSIFIIIFYWSYYASITENSLQDIHWRDILIAFGILGVVQLITLCGNVVNRYVADDTIISIERQYHPEDPLNVFPLYMILYAICLGVIMPILFELIFRGLFTALLFDPQRFIIPAICSAIFFASSREFGNIFSFLTHFFVSITLHYAYYRRGNIIDAILVHILNNTIGIALILITYFLL